MKKLIFVMVAAFGLMLVSCKTNPASTASEAASKVTSASEVISMESTSVVEEVSEESAASDIKATPGKPEAKEGVDVTTPAKPTEEVKK